MKIHKLAVLEILFRKRLQACEMRVQNEECFKSERKAEDGYVRGVNTNRLLWRTVDDRIKLFAFISLIWKIC